MSESERNIVRALIVAAGFDERDVDWMVASCPSLKRARQVCNEQRRRR